MDGNCTIVHIHYILIRDTMMLWFVLVILGTTVLLSYIIIKTHHKFSDPFPFPFYLFFVIIPYFLLFLLISDLLAVRMNYELLISGPVEECSKLSDVGGGDRPCKPTLTNWAITFIIGILYPIFIIYSSIKVNKILH